MQIINDPNATFSGRMARSLGTSLEGLANTKLQQLQQRHQQAQTTKGFEALGMPKQVAERFSMFPETIQRDIIKDYLQQGGLEGMQGLQPQQQNTIESLKALMPANQQAQIIPEEMQRQTLEQAQKTAPQKVSALQEATQSFKIPPPAEIKGLTPKSSAIYKRPTNAREALANSEAIKVSRVEQNTANKETLPIYKKISENAKEAGDNNRRIGRMEELIKGGNLSYPIWNSLLDTVSNGVFGFGIDLHSLQSADSQEFNKLSNEFLKNAKNIFGARITDNDIKAFMKMVPSLSQTDDGKMRIINNMKAYNAADLIRKQAMDDVIEQSGGQRPANLETLIEKRAKPQLDALAKEFVSGYKENVLRAPTKKGLLAGGLDNPMELFG